MHKIFKTKNSSKTSLHLFDAWPEALLATLGIIFCRLYSENKLVFIVSCTAILIFAKDGQWSTHGIPKYFPRGQKLYSNTKPRSTDSEKILLLSKHFSTDGTGVRQLVTTAVHRWLVWVKEIVFIIVYNLSCVLPFILFIFYIIFFIKIICDVFRWSENT